MDSYSLDRRALIRLLRVLAPSQHAAESIVAAQGLSLVWPFTFEVLWDALSGNRRKAEAAQVLFDLALENCPHLEHQILAIRHGQRSPLPEQLPTVVSSFFQASGKPRPLGRLLIEYWEERTHQPIHPKDRAL